jgi:hypothetical protein
MLLIILSSPDGMINCFVKKGGYIIGKLHELIDLKRRVAGHFIPNIATEVVSGNNEGRY